jgi:hypothetical protein
VIRVRASFPCGPLLSRSMCMAYVKPQLATCLHWRRDTGPFGTSWRNVGSHQRRPLPDGGRLTPSPSHSTARRLPQQRTRQRQLANRRRPVNGGGALAGEEHTQLKGRPSNDRRRGPWPCNHGCTSKPGTGHRRNPKNSSSVARRARVPARANIAHGQRCRAPSVTVDEDLSSLAGAAMTGLDRGVEMRS